MKTYYIQFSTDFHLLASFASIESLPGSGVVLVGPKTSFALLVAEKISAELIVADPRSPELSFIKMFFLFARSKRCKDCVIVSPFVFPFYTFLRLLEKGRAVSEVVRTDEGVGSYASVGHYYASFIMERPERAKLSCAIKAVVKRLSVWVTKFLRICREEYIFKSDLTIDKERVERLRANIDQLGRLDGISGRVVYVSQPGIFKGFKSEVEYVQFLREVGRKFDSGEVVVKRHPSDMFDYTAHGFEVIEGFPLELYNLDGSIIIGFSSTALLMAKILSDCDKVYYIKMKGPAPFYSNLSPMNRRLFDFYLTPLSHCD